VNFKSLHETTDFKIHQSQTKNYCNAVTVGFVKNFDLRKPAFNQKGLILLKIKKNKMEQNSTTNSGAGKSLGVAGLVIGIISLIFSCIPCLGVWAIVPAIVGVILSAVSMKQAGAGGSKGMAMAGLVCSIAAILIACYWMYLMFFGASQIMNEIEKSGALDSLSNAFKQAGDSINKAMEQIKEITDTTNKQ
jgi:hypothetical protein